jgi:electron transfer flavoprotein alpha subunit|tara:strand:+ start:352 stop:1305 length:954 start_codon:yes stop_codon:yes gene_type:complete
MAVLVIAEHDNQVLKTSTLNTITAAQKINNEVHLIILGKDIQTLSDTSKSIHLLSKVLKCDNEKLENFLPEILAPIIAKTALSYSHVIAPASTFGKNLLPRISALLDTTQVSDIIGIENENTFIRPIYAGNAISHVQTNQEINLLTIRPSSFEKCENSGGEATLEEIPFIDSEAKTLFVSKEVSKSDRPELGSARIVVSGGRGLENSDNFKLLYDLADKLNAAVGASRAAVDSGYIGNEYQVGQTGKMVAPELYIAVGISGAIQHLAGMKESKVIVAINKDLEAPIFNVADYGLSSDLFQAIPEIIKELDLLNQIDS